MNGDTETIGGFGISFERSRRYVRTGENAQLVTLL